MSHYAYNKKTLNHDVITIGEYKAAKLEAICMVGVPFDPGYIKNTVYAPVGSGEMEIKRSN